MSKRHRSPEIQALHQRSAQFNQYADIKVSERRATEFFETRYAKPKPQPEITPPQVEQTEQEQPQRPEQTAMAESACRCLLTQTYHTKYSSGGTPYQTTLAATAESIADNWNITMSKDDQYIWKLELKHCYDDFSPRERDELILEMEHDSHKVKETCNKCSEPELCSCLAPRDVRLGMLVARTIIAQ
ncbi:hypothetical protein FWF74_03250 [Candidatus Saccharibacteria bacterium]|nr:hypothetical protein [Candidatus Saccharibacteria bacterium]MCL1962807.1 hypothetical protein [Candidatus Saccharibacteria bacterium]